MERKSARRILWLDVLRGIAILLVVTFHFTTRYAQKYPHNSFSNALLLKVQFGWIGVHLFFMISGFIIYLTIQKKRGIWDFLVARLSRLMPPYWTAILVILALEYLHIAVFKTPNRHDLVSTLFNVAMVPDLFKMPFLDGAFWSLYVEIKFYISFAILWQVLDMKKKRNFYMTYFLLFFASMTHNYIHTIPLGENLNYFLLFWTGIAACKFLKEDMGIWEYSFIALLTTAGTLGYYVDGYELIVGVPVFAALFATADHLFSNYLFFGKVFAPVAFLGRISYSFYLIHQPVGYIVLGFLAGLAFNYNIAVLFGTATCVLFSLAGFVFVEQLDKPIANYITNRFLYRKNKAEICT